MVSLLRLFPPLFPFLKGIILWSARYRADRVGLHMYGSRLRHHQQFLDVDTQQMAQTQHPHLLPLSGKRKRGIGYLYRIHPPRRILHRHEVYPFPVVFHRRQRSFNHIILSGIFTTCPKKATDTEKQDTCFHPYTLEFQQR